MSQEQLPKHRLGFFKSPGKFKRTSVCTWEVERRQRRKETRTEGQVARHRRHGAAEHHPRDAAGQHHLHRHLRRRRVRVAVLPAAATVAVSVAAACRRGCLVRVCLLGGCTWLHQTVNDTIKYAYWTALEVTF